MNIWTTSETEYLKSNYDKYSIRELSEHLNKTKSAVQSKARRVGLAKKSKYHYDKDFFEEISMPTKAYWLGFIYADGYVAKEKGKTSTYSVGIELSLRDERHLKYFNKDIGGNVGITKRHREGLCHSKAVIGNICSIRLYCSKMAIDLINHGCCLGKSLIKGAPRGVPDKLMRDFIRGYFDGNGSISDYIKKDTGHSYVRVSITSGSLKFVEWLSSYLSNIGIGNSYYPDGENSYKIQIMSASLKNFLDYIYKNSERHLDRKYEKYIVAVCGDNT